MDEKPKLRDCSRGLLHAIIRSKPLDREAMMETELKRNLKGFHVLMYGIGTMIGNAIYGIVAVVARKYSGPSTFLCFLMGGLVGFLNGMSYSELAAQIPKAGSAFVYTYVIAGELLAFMAGWLALLEYISTASSAAVLAANTINVLSNGTLEEFMMEHIGILGGADNEILNHYPNIVAFLICLLAIALLTCGNDASFFINCILSIVTLVVLAMATGFMYAHFDPDYMLSKSHDLFLPHDVNGFLSGSGIAFGTFIGFEAMTVAGEEVENPQRVIPRVTFQAIGVVTVVSVIHSLAFTGYTPWWEVNANYGLAAVFTHHHVAWLKIIVSVSTMVAAFCSILCSLYAITRIVYAMASDGLLFKILSWIQPKLKVPLVALYSFGLLVAVASIFFNYAALTSFMSISAVLAYIIVTCDLLIVRFMKPELYPEECPKNVGFLYEHFQNIKWLRSKSRGLVPCAVLTLFMISSAISTYFFMDVSKEIYKGTWWAILVLSLLLSIVISCAAIIGMFQPFKEKSQFFMVPFVPFVPLLSLFLNIAVIIKLPIDSWVRVIFWILMGLLIYFAYGMWKSTLRDAESKKQNYDSIQTPENSIDSESSTKVEYAGTARCEAVVEMDEKTPIAAD